MLDSQSPCLLDIHLFRQHSLVRLSIFWSFFLVSCKIVNGIFSLANNKDDDNQVNSDMPAMFCNSSVSMLLPHTSQIPYEQRWGTSPHFTIITSFTFCLPKLLLCEGRDHIHLRSLW